MDKIGTKIKFGDHLPPPMQECGYVEKCRELERLHKKLKPIEEIYKKWIKVEMVSIAQRDRETWKAIQKSQEATL
jgi:hypothetical protein